MLDEARITNEATAKKRAEILGLRYFDTSVLHEPPLYKNLIDMPFMYENHTVVLSSENGSVIIGITSRTPQSAMSKLREKFENDRVSFVMISQAGFNDFMELYDPPKEMQYRDVEITADSSSTTLEEVTRNISEVLSEDLFDYLIKQAQRLSASDLHLENSRDDSIRIRFRVHGVLHDIARLDREKFRQLMSTIASLADVSTQAPKPQTGHISYQQDSNEINIRIETVPTLYGQDVVLRIFTIDMEMLELTRLGLNETEQEMIEDVIEHPSGLVLAVGPTGSGKTTTLYSIINKLNNAGRKIITLEDPVEYSLDGLVQIPVKTMKEESFADTLRAVMRLDPDVIMIGEIRDKDTANTALQAALSGHLVLSTFHGADVASALARLMSFAGDNPLFTSAVRLVIAQRLVRELDSETKTAYQPEPHIVEKIEAALGDNLAPNTDMKLYHAVSSEKSPFGYSGRTSVVELVEIDGEIEKFLHDQGQDISTDELREMFKEHGTRTLLQSALLKALDGTTTLEEVYRVL